MMAAMGERTLRRDTAVVTACTLLSRISGFGRVLATAAVLGSGLLGDVYQSANLVPNLLFELAAGGVLQAVLVPGFVAARRDGGDEGLGLAAAATSGVLLVGLAAVAALGLIVSPIIAHLLVASEPSSSTASDKLDVLVPMLLVFIPQLVCYGVGMVAAAALSARGRFVSAALAPAVNNVIVIVACLLFRQALHGSESSLSLSPWQFGLIAGGTTLGVIAFSATPVIALRLQGVPIAVRWQPRHPAVQLLRGSFGWATLSVVGTFIPMATALVLGNGAAGGVAVFVYAFAFFVLPHALVAVPLATTLSPRVADRWQRKEIDHLRRDVDSAVRIGLPLLSLAAVALAVLAWPLARAAAFGQTASQGIAPIAHTLAAFGPGLIGYGVAFVMLRVLMAIGDVRGSAVLQVTGAVAGTTVMIVLALSLHDSERSAALAIGYGVAQLVAAALLLARVHRLTGAASPRSLLRTAMESLVCSGLAAATMLVVVRRFDTSRRASALALILGGASGLVVFCVAFAAIRSRAGWSASAAVAQRLRLRRSGGAAT